MESLVYIKTTSFGGYDKNETEAVLEKLYTKIYSLENKVKEDAVLLEGYKKGQKEQSISEEILNENKKLLADTRGKLQSLMDKEKQMEVELEEKSSKITELSDELAKCKEDLNKANQKISTSGQNNSESLSKVFIEAQKSADMLIEDAKKQADVLGEDAHKLAESIIAEANEKAAQIIDDAEKEAAKAEARAQSAEAEFSASSSNLKAFMYNDIKVFGETISKLKDTIKEFEKSGSSILAHSETVLNHAEATLTEGGIPEFTDIQPLLTKGAEANKDLDDLMDIAKSLEEDIPLDASAADVSTIPDIKKLPKMPMSKKS